ncbi:MAG: prenyltransferase/squalene oxidase repeat-containing protein [Phycisphaerae bacterium]
MMHTTDRTHPTGINGRSLTAGLAAVLLTIVATSAPARAEAPSSVLPDMVTRESVKSTKKGLNYLVRTQRNDGSWFNAGSHGTYPCVMTSLAGMALLGSGSTPESGTYSRNVHKAMQYLLKVSEAHKDGLIADDSGGASRTMYGHGFSLLFLSQCYGTEINKKYEKRLKTALDKAVDLVERSQSKEGGWIYTPNGRSDEGSVTITQLQALRAARNVGIKVNKKTIDKAVQYIKKCQNADGGICYSLRSRGSSRPPISAAGIACFYSAGVYDKETGGRGEEAKMVEKLVAYCKRTIKVSGGSRGAWGHYYYAHYYFGQSMYMRGGKDWKDYFPKMRDHLIKLQQLDGSWDGDGVGPVYGTAVACTLLQLPYGYVPIYQR